MEVSPEEGSLTSYSRSGEPIWQLLESQGLVGPRTGTLLKFVALSWFGPLLHVGLAIMSAHFLTRVPEVMKTLSNHDENSLSMFFFGASVACIGMALTLAAACAFISSGFVVKMLEEHYSPIKGKAKATMFTFAIDSKLGLFSGYVIFWHVLFGFALDAPTLVTKASNTLDFMSVMLVMYYLYMVFAVCLTSCGWHAAMSWCEHLSNQMATSIRDEIEKCDDVTAWMSVARHYHQVSDDMIVLWEKASFIYLPYMFSVSFLGILGIVLSIRCSHQNLWSGCVSGVGLAGLCIVLTMAKAFDMSRVTSGFMSTSPRDESVISKAMSKYGTMRDHQAAQHSYFVQYVLSSPTGARYLGVLVDYSLVVRLLAGNSTALSAVISGLVAFHAQGSQ